MTEIGAHFLDDHQIIKLRYYGIHVFSSLRDRRKLDANKSLGRLIIFLGLCLVGISATDLSELSVTIVSSEQSIWPSTGKGIWVGFYAITVGIFTLIAVKEKTHSAFHILLPYTVVAAILCLFSLLTSIVVVDRYLQHPILSITKNRTKGQGIQFALNSMLIGLFGLIFLFFSCLSCTICWTIPKFGATHQYLRFNQSSAFRVNFPTQEMRPRTPQSPLYRTNPMRPRFIHRRFHGINN